MCCCCCCWRKKLRESRLLVFFSLSFESASTVFFLTLVGCHHSHCSGTHKYWDPLLQSNIWVMTFIKRKKNFFPVLPCVIVIYTYPKVPGTLHPLHPRFFFSFSFVFVFSFYFWVITRPHISVTMLCIREKQNHLFFLENFAFFE